MQTDLSSYLLLAFQTFFVLGAVLYFIFSLVIVRQTASQTKHVIDKFNSILVAFSYIHAIFAFFLILLTLFAL